MIEAIIAGVSAIVVALLGTGFLNHRQTKDVKKTVRHVETSMNETLEPHCAEEVAELAGIRKQMEHLQDEQATTNQLLAQITHGLEKRLTLLEDRQSRFHPGQY